MPNDDTIGHDELPEHVQRAAARAHDALAGLEGGVILDAAPELDHSYGTWEVWPCLRVRTTGGDIVHVTVSQDPEGNGPGHLFIDPEG